MGDWYYVSETEGQDIARSRDEWYASGQPYASWCGPARGRSDALRKYREAIRPPDTVNRS